MKKELTDKLKHDIILYVDHIYRNHIDKEADLTKQKVPHAYFLEFLYRTCLDNYQEHETYELYESKIKDIIQILSFTEKMLIKFKLKEVKLIGIGEDSLLLFEDKTLQEPKLKKNDIDI